jgi:hypothetical protein
MPKVVRTPDGRIRVETTEADRIAQLDRQRAESAKTQERIARWRALLADIPVTRDLATVRAVAVELRAVAVEVAAGGLRLPEGEILAMSLLCKAMAAGALSEPEHVGFRTRILERPHWINAMQWLLKWDSGHPSAKGSGWLTQGCPEMAGVLEAMDAEKPRPQTAVLDHNPAPVRWEMLSEIQQEILRTVNDSSVPLKTIEDIAKATPLRYEPDSTFRGHIANLKRLRVLDKQHGQYVAVVSPPMS